MLLSTAYFPNVHYFTKLLFADQVFIEVCEHYQKQSFRNRCDISAANGVMSLSVPVLKGRSRGMPIRDAQISYETPWQKIHFRSIESAYRHAPFYEFLMDDLIHFWEKREKFLLDLNMKILETLLGLLTMSDVVIQATEAYAAPENPESDWRQIIHPKHAFPSDQSFNPLPYNQVFIEKNGFQANLSILDTLFQLGPETRKYLTDCWVRI